MADIFFLLAGIVLLFKNEVQISRKRKLTGETVKILGILYILPFVTALILGIVTTALGIDLVYALWASMVLPVFAILVTLYFIFFIKRQMSPKIKL